MEPVSVAFFWHQHQPYYPDDVSGENLMPWVRLHGTKDYIGMALHIQEVPEFRCTINLVPSLLVQIQRYVDGDSDRHLQVARRSADSLSPADASFLLDNSFLCNAETMIRPYPRYYELYHKRSSGRDTAERALSRFNAQDLRDLQCWFNLTWMHELLFEQDVELREFRRKAKGWSEVEKNWLLDRQREILARIIPLHRDLSNGGQVELTTTPFYHPILPLLWDKRSARQAMPGCEMPKHVEPYRDDAVEQVRRAVEQHRQMFGVAPRGMWPSEGSVSQEIIPLIAEAGIEWIATDEEILSYSTDHFVGRDANGHVNRPEMLFRPWRVEHEGKSLQIVFRDHGLSDQVGFHYQRNDPVWAADDMVNKVLGIGRAVAGRTGGRPALVPIVLDGENCWEFYPDGGVRFLRHLYRQAAANPGLRPVRMIDHLDQYPATDRISRLFAGSWISHNFSIWIGHEEDRNAWDHLHHAREFLKAEAGGGHSADRLRRAWDELYIAEGSDWFWWFGEDHSCAQDALFDQLFRKHLQNIYMLLGESAPASLMRPIKRLAKRLIHTQPRTFLDVKVDGRRSYFEWLNAGIYTAGSERSTMSMVTSGLIRKIHFGFNATELFLRMDTVGRAVNDLATASEIRIRFSDPDGTEIRLQAPWTQPKVEIYLRHQPTTSTNATAAAGEILEVSVPLSELQLTMGDGVQLFVDVRNGRESMERVPGEGTIETIVPSIDFESRIWQA